jgi:nucleoside-diphosphate-sugar epimerase
VDDVADAHVAAVTRLDPAREYAIGGVNAPQQAIYEFVRARRGRPLPRRLPYAFASAIGLAQETYAAITQRPPLVTRGAVTIFRHDWPLDSAAAQRDLALRMTPLETGLDRTLAAL